MVSRSAASIVALAALAGAAFAQSSEPPIEIDPGLKTVTIRARGADVRQVLFDLFDQTGRSFILDPSVKMELFLSLRDIAFDEALAAILDTADLKEDIQNGISYITRNEPMEIKATADPVEPEPRPEVQQTPVKPPSTAPASTPPLSNEPPIIGSDKRLTDRDLNAKRVTLKMEKATLREIFSEIRKQTGIEFELTGRVPGYRVDINATRRSLLTVLLDLVRATGTKMTKSAFGTIVIDAEPKTENN